jgi:hypothetical protein
MTVSRELSRYQLDLVGAQEVRCAGRDTNQQENAHFSIERGMRTMNFVQFIFCIRESCQQLRGLSLLVVGCHT